MPSDNKSLRQLGHLARRLIEIREWPSSSELDQQTALQAPVEALLAVVDCLDRLTDFKGDGPGRGLTKPLWDLVVAIESISDGNAHPLLTPPKTGERARSSEQQALMGWSAIAFDCYQKAGFTRQAAGEAVADELSTVKLSYGRMNKLRTGKTVEGWVNKLREGGASAPPKALIVWHRYLDDRRRRPDFPSDEWVDWALQYLRRLIKDRPILKSLPRKVED